MSRFVAPDLSALGKPPIVVPVDFETIKSNRDGNLIAALNKYGVDFDVDGLLTDPLMIAHSEGGGYQETLWRQRVNEAIEALSLASAYGQNLQHIGGTYTRTDRLYLATELDDPPTEFEAEYDADRQEWVEKDDHYRDRIALSFEAFSTAGPAGAYIFHALELDGQRDISDAEVYSEEDGAVYRSTLHADAFSMGLRPTAFDSRNAGDPVLAPEILLIVLPTANYGAVDQSLLDRVFDVVNAKEVRPIGDNVRVEAADIIPYEINVTLKYAPGADVSVLKAASEARLLEYVNTRRRIGFDIQREVIGGRAAIDDKVHVTVNEPAANISPGSYAAAQCSGITVTCEQGHSSWS